MHSRKSIRTYADAAIPQECLDAILKAASLAPTSRDLRPCTFHLVTDREQLTQLGHAKAHGAAFTAHAGAAVVVAADSTVADTWIEDSAIAMTYMMLTAEALGLGCCWVQMHLRTDADGNSAEDNVRQILGLQEQHRIVGFLSLGVRR